jgi:hypothetical protein
VVLPPGRYLFEGRARTHGLVPANPREFGATLRIVGVKPTPQVVAEGDWKQVSFEFDVPSGGDQVELVCELTAIIGEASFDAKSLRLVKLGPATPTARTVGMR